jgi:hypothetical protein
MRGTNLERHFLESIFRFHIQRPGGVSQASRRILAAVWVCVVSSGCEFGIVDSRKMGLPWLHGEKFYFPVGIIVCSRLEKVRGGSLRGLLWSVGRGNLVPCDAAWGIMSVPLHPHLTHTASTTHRIESGPSPRRRPSVHPRFLAARLPL